MGADHRCKLTIKLLATVLLCALPGFGQANVGELRLRVTDPAGLGVESAVELISEVNQFSDSYATDGKGKLQVDRLPFGVYQVRVHREGFATFSGSLEIRSVFPVTYHVGLSVAVATTSVVVIGQPTLIDPYRVGNIDRIGSQAIESRQSSIPGRSVVDLVNTQPGWLYEGNAVLHPRGSEYQVQFVVDGVPLTDNRSPSFGPDIDADDVQSLSIYTANFPAEYGRKMGGVVEVDTARVGAEYGSGLPVEFEGTIQEALAEYGSEVVDRVDLAHGRVRPNFSLDASAGISLYHSDRLDMHLQADVQNFNNRLNVIDFAGLFSGNAIGPPRSAFVRLQTNF